MSRIGDLRHRVDLQVIDRVQGDGGQWVETPRTLAGVNAHIEPLSGSERLAAMRLEHAVTHRITVRYGAGLSAARRIVFGLRTFRVVSALNEGERDRWIVFMAEEGGGL